MQRSGFLAFWLLQLVISVASQPLPQPVQPSTPRIDTHCHYVPPFYAEYLAARGIDSGGRPIPAWNVSAHLAMNALFGISTSVVSISTPGAKLKVDSPIEEGRMLARYVNEYGHNLTVEYPKRFLFFATLTLPDLEGAVAEAVYALDTLAAAGVIVEASTHGELLGTPRFAPLYKVLNDRKAVVFIHPSNSPCAEESTTSTNSTGIPPFVIDFLLDTSRAALNLVYRNVTRDYPDITFLLAHSGGFLPFGASRAAGGLALLSGTKDPTLGAYFLNALRQFHADIAISANPFSLRATTTFFNSTQITYGSDFPYPPVSGIAQNTNDFDNFGSMLTSGKRFLRRANYNNAYRLFKKFLD